MKICSIDGLINAVSGDTENGLIFASAKVWQINEIQTVKEVIEDLLQR